MKNYLSLLPCFLIPIFFLVQTAIAFDLQLQQKLIIPNGEGSNWFGRRIIIDNDYAFISATGVSVEGRGAQGMVYVFKKKANFWELSQELTSGGGNDRFGRSLAIQGPILVVGANQNVGRAHVYKKIGGKYVKVKTLTIPEGHENASIGWCVDTNGDFIIVSAPSFNVGDQMKAGSVFVFKKVDGDWSLIQKLIEPDGQAGNKFGIYAAISENTLAVSSLMSDRAGAVYLYSIRNGKWILQQRLNGTASPRHYFGNPLRFFGGQLYVGATGYGEKKSGSVMIYSKINGSWVQSQIISPSNSNDAARFGGDFSVHENVLAVGALRETYNQKKEMGVVYLYKKKKKKWFEIKKLFSPDGGERDEFGHLAVSQETLIVGAAFHSVGTRKHQGAAYVFSY